MLLSRFDRRGMRLSFVKKKLARAAQGSRGRKASLFPPH
jgi:hypothetical protein